MDTHQNNLFLLKSSPKKKIQQGKNNKKDNRNPN